MSARCLLSSIVLGTLCWVAIFWSLLLAGAFGHVHGCRTAACDKRIHEKRRAHWKRTHIWEYRWHHVDPWLKAALSRVRFCESRNNYRASNGSHWGGYQYSWGRGSAGERAGFRVRPDYASPREQDVRTAWFWPSHRGEWQCKA